MNKFVSETKDILKSNGKFFSDLNINYKKFILSNPNFPKLYGLPKIHKSDIPMRPVVSFFNTPVSDLSKFLNQFLIEILDFSPKFTVKNSLELIKHITNNQLPLHTFKMISFDVSNLFTNVPRDETIPLIIDKLNKNNVSTIIINHLTSLLKLCLSQDFFTFNNKYYRQTQGLAMGNPLSPFLSDLFLDNLENKYIFNNHNKFGKVKAWYRYVDDILAFIDGSPPDIEQILDEMNLIHPAIIFTVELENNNSINFLDLTIRKTVNKLEFSIYRKPTQTDHLIPSSSSHPFQHKMAALYCYTNRLLNIPMSHSNFNKELNILKQLAFNNGYNPNIIHNIINKMNFKFRRRLAFNSHTSNIENLIYRSLPYHGSMSKNISSILLKKIPNLKISFKVHKTIKSIFSKTKDTTELLQKSGIYKLHCNDCNATYVGRTTRPLVTRIKEHLTRTDKSSFGFHLKFNNHTFSPNDNCKILHTIHGRDFTRFNLLEDLEILREMEINPDYCLNTQINLNCQFKPLFKFFWN